MPGLLVIGTSSICGGGVTNYTRVNLMRQLCLCLFVELNTIKVSGSKTVGGVAKGVTVLINLVWIDMHTERAFIWLGSIYKQVHLSSNQSA